MDAIFGPSWRTSLTGYVLAAWIAVEPLIKSDRIDWGMVALAALVAVMGRLAKDHNVTGTGGPGS